MVKIRKLHLGAFGKFENFSLDFSSGLNLIEGMNETGKSTVHTFIEGMLFGFYTRNIKVKRYTEKHEHYRPRHLNRYEGYMIVELKDKRLRIERNFDKKQGFVKVFNDKSGKDITASFDKHPVYQEVDIASIIGISYPVFKNTVSISQAALKTDKTIESDLSALLEKLSKSGSVSFDINKAIHTLDEELETIGSVRAASKPYAKALKQQEALETKLEAATKQQGTLKTLYQEKQALSEQYSELNQEKEALEIHIKQQENQEKIETLNRVKSYKASIDKLLNEPYHQDLDAYYSLYQSYEALFSDVSKDAHALLNAELKINTLNEELPNKDDILDTEQYRALEATQTEVKNLEPYIKPGDLKTLKDTLNTTEQTKKTTAKTYQTWHKRLTRLTYSALPLMILGGLLGYFVLSSQALWLYGSLTGATIILVLFDIIFLKRLNQKQHKAQEAFEKALSAYEKEEKAQALVKQSLDKIYHKLGAKDQASFLEKLYEAKLKHENYLRYQALQAKIKTEKNQIQAILDKYKPLIEHLNLKSSTQSLKRLNEINEHLGAMIKLIPAGAFLAFKASIDFSMPKVKTTDKAQKETALETLKDSLQTLKDQMHEKALKAERYLDHAKDIEALRAALENQKKRIDNMKRELGILNQAKAMLERAFDKQEENFAPKLSEAIKAYLKPLTMKRYEEIKVRRTLSAKIYSPLSHQLEPLDFFSRGTKDQIYIAIRLGLLKALEIKTMFLLIDDAFAFFDQARLKVALKMLGELSKTTQVIIFTTHTREKHQLDKLSIQYKRHTLS